MWAPADLGLDGIRHTCEDGHHNRYGWHKHDGEGWGRQEIEDLQGGVHLTTHFLKEHAEGATKGWYF